jgi:hypothetical protein
MNDNYNRVPTEFGPETRFDVPTLPFRAMDEGAFERLKADLLARRLAAVWDAEANSSVRRAANEAAALAWVTPYPMLVFPALFEEKVNASELHAKRQDAIRQRSRELLAAA